MLITGANRGIGLELARQYAAKDWNVIATSRRAADDAGNKELKAIMTKHPNLVIERIDVTDTKMIRSVAAKYKDQPIDVLINNAAAVEQTFQADLEKVNIPYDKIDFDAARNDFDVNTLGPMRMVQAFMPNVEKSKQKKVVNVTSFVGSYDKGGTPMGMNYGASKAAPEHVHVQAAPCAEVQGHRGGARRSPCSCRASRASRACRCRAPSTWKWRKLVKIIDGMTVESAGGKITNFSTGKIDPW